MAVCPNCGTKLHKGAGFCTECGQPVPAQSPAAAPEAAKPARSGSGKTVLIICLAVLLLAGATLGVLFFTGVLGGNKDYDRAMELYKQGDYPQAAEIFEQLGDYKDSAEMASNCRYQQALTAFNLEDYEQALTLFQGLGDYRDSAELAERCQQKIHSGPAGSWTLTGLFEGGEDYSDYLTMLGMDITMVLNEDGTGTMQMADETISVTWDDNAITSEGDSIPYVLEGDTLTMEQDGMRMVFTRSSALPETPAPVSEPAPAVEEDDGICGTWVGEWDYNGAHIRCVMIIRPDGTYERHHTKDGAPSGSDDCDYVFENNVLITYKDAGHTTSIRYDYVNGRLTNNGHYLDKVEP